MHHGDVHRRLDEGLDGVADIADMAAGLGRRDAAHHRLVGHVAEAPRLDADVAGKNMRLVSPTEPSRITVTSTSTISDPRTAFSLGMP